jgi:hypothetical protein
MCATDELRRALGLGVGGLLASQSRHRSAAVISAILVLYLVTALMGDMHGLV